MTRGLFDYQPHWAIYLLPAPVLPTSRSEMEALGWDECDVVLVTGDAYVDHPSFGSALIGRLLEAHGFRVGVIDQPDWHGPEAFRALGRPALFFGVTSGAMDSMVNRYTADRRRRSDDAYSPDDQPDRRPDRAAIVYAQRCRQAYPGVPVVLGGLEASLRRLAHYDYWSDKVRRSILLDAKADLLLYGNAERAVVELAHRLAKGASIDEIDDLAGSAFARRAGVAEASDALRLPSTEQVVADPEAHARAAREIAQQCRPATARSLVQPSGDREIWVRPPPEPLTTAEFDRLFELPYTRRPHPRHAGRRLAAWEMIRHSVTIVRGCFGGCSFCALASHEGPIIQSRSADSVVREIERLRDTDAAFTGVVSDLGGPTANMYRMGCRRGPKGCRRLSCLYPAICPQLEADHAPLLELYRRARSLPGVKKVLIGSGVRTDLALRSKAYVRELVAHHVGGYLKVAPEHVCPGPLECMQKPGPEVHERFASWFHQASAAAGLEQYLIPYLIAAHPGTRDEDMVELAVWLKRHGYRPEQVQTFLPSPMTLATAMYATGRNPLRSRPDGSFERVIVPRGERTRRLHKALLRYHDPANWPLLRRELVRLGRGDLIGPGKGCLVSAPSRPGSGKRPEKLRRRSGPAHRRKS